MRIVFFDLGNTLEQQDVLMPGAIELLTAVQAMHGPRGSLPVMGLISDFYMPASPGDIPRLQEEYYHILEILGIREFFEPVNERVTLSSEVGVFKPDESIFRAAIDKIHKDLAFGDTLFITEERSHVEAARALGMRAIHFKGPGQTEGDVDCLLDLKPRIEEFLDIPTPRALLRKDRATRLAASSLPPDTRRACADPAGAVAAPWARFGDEVVLFSDQHEWRDMATRARRSTSELRDLGSVPKRERLHLVVQKGNLFRRENPNVSVLYDKGRYLIVDLEPEEARRLDQTDRPCYSIRPLQDNQVVFEYHTPGARRAVPVPWVQALVDKVSHESFARDLNQFASFRTRLSGTDYYMEAATWARTQLATRYLTRLQDVAVNGVSSPNVIAEKRGQGLGIRDLVIVAAHLDSITAASAADSPAPGADDNASGSAGILQLARVFEDHPGVHDVRFVLFAGEEQGLRGSRHYVAGLPEDERARITAVINMDMIGSLNTSSPTVLLEGHNLSRHVVNSLALAAETYTSLRIQKSFAPYNSDHVSFLDANIPAVLTIEGSDGANEYVHTNEDTVDRIHFDLALDILRANAAFLAGALDTAE